MCWFLSYEARFVDVSVAFSFWTIFEMVLVRFTSSAQVDKIYIDRHGKVFY